MSSTGDAGAGAILGMIGGGMNARKQYHRQKKLMGLQQQNQMMLNRQGHDLQMDMWNKTNYGAQVKHMEDAGLNPALMYGMGGGGGTTAGSQGGGSAASGQAQAQTAMDMANIGLISAQIEKIKAETKNIDKGTEKTGQDILESIARTSNIGADEKLKVEQKLKTISETKLNEERKKLEERKNNKGLTGSALIDGFTAIGLDPIGNVTDMYIARGMVGAWLGKDYVKMFMDMLPAGQVKKFSGSFKQIGKNKVEW